MTTELLLGRVAQIPPGEGRNFEVGGLRLAVFHTRAGEIFATQAQCPHRGGPLADGLVGNATVICPLHDRMYDLRTGSGLNQDCVVRTYPVRQTAEGDILLGLEG
jgi:nitrite reductase (NADH) small subunit